MAKAQPFTNVLGQPYVTETVVPIGYQSQVTMPGVQSGVLAVLNGLAQSLQGVVPSLTVSSGYRSPAYNAAIYAARGQTPTNSEHSRGTAIDLSLNGLTLGQKQAVVQAILSDPNVTGFGIYDPNVNSVHFDTGHEGRIAWYGKTSKAFDNLAPDWVQGLVEGWKSGDYDLAALSDLGFPATPEGVKSFQASMGLVPDGIIGPQTLAALAAARSSESSTQGDFSGFANHGTLSRGDRGPAVVALQQSLNAMGANLVADGEFGPATQAAVAAFQSTMGLSADGIAGPATWAAMPSTNNSGFAFGPMAAMPSTQASMVGRFATGFDAPAQVAQAQAPVTTSMPSATARSANSPSIASLAVPSMPSATAKSAPAPAASSSPSIASVLSGMGPFSGQPAYTTPSYAGLVSGPTASGDATAAGGRFSDAFAAVANMPASIAAAFAKSSPNFSIISPAEASTGGKDQSRVTPTLAPVLNGIESVQSMGDRFSDAFGQTNPFDVALSDDVNTALRGLLNDPTIVQSKQPQVVEQTKEIAKPQPKVVQKVVQKTKPLSVQVTKFNQQPAQPNIGKFGLDLVPGWYTAPSFGVNYTWVPVQGAPAGTVAPAGYAGGYAPGIGFVAGTGPGGTYGGAGSAFGSAGASGAASAGTVLCTFFMRKGKLPRRVWAADTRYSATLPRAQYLGYRAWADPILAAMERGDASGRKIERLMWPIVRAWAHEAARRHTGKGRGSKAGARVHDVLGPLSLAIGERLLGAGAGHAMAV